jgi:DNA-binding HxlR family transcriptional regulator
MNDEHGLSAFCPVFHKAVELIGRRWTGAIIRAMQSGRTRFSDIAHVIPGLSDRLLSERLKELEMEGIVTRSVYPETPVRIEYELTEKGKDLDVVMQAIGEWSYRWVEVDPEAEEKCIGDSLEECDASESAVSARAVVR